VTTKKERRKTKHKLYDNGFILYAERKMRSGLGMTKNDVSSEQGRGREDLGDEEEQGGDQKEFKTRIAFL